MKKISAPLLLTFLLASFSLSGNNDLSDLRGLTLTNAKIPIYNRGGKPQMMIFVNRAERHGRVISGTETVLDFIRPTASVDDIGDAWRIKPYPLKAPFKQIFDFWLPRLKYSEAVVATPKADIDPESHKASGSAPIYLRSPLLDLNGIGFEADFDRREIRVNSDIEVVVRTGASDPRKPDSIHAAKHSFITATGDSLLIELEAKRIMLIGSVTVTEAQAKISCDRLTIMLNENESKKTEQKNKQLFSPETEAASISKLLADGNIVISGTRKQTGKMYADHLVYDLHNRKITLSSDDFGKVMSRAEIKTHAAELNSVTPGNIQGYVILDDTKLRTYGKSIQINLRKTGGDISSGVLLTSGMTGAEAEKHSGALENITYPSGIVISGKPDPAQKGGASFLLDADYGEFLPDQNVINLKNNVTAQDGDTILCCDNAILKLKQNRSDTGAGASAAGVDTIMCRRNVRLLHKNAAQKSGTLSSDKADFLVAENRIIFFENVHAVHEQSDMTCNQLELFLADAQKSKSARLHKKSTELMDNAASGKTLERAVATGNVKMTDPNAVLTTGLLTMYFKSLAPGEKPADGMLHAGGARLSRVECDNGIKVVSAEKGDTSGIFGTTGSKGARTLSAMRSETDLQTNKSTFSGNVSISDELSKLECDTMHLFGMEKKPDIAKKTAAADPDADPFALLDTENFAPSRVAIAGNVELDKVECHENVKITRKIADKALLAGGKRADYKVSTRKIIISGTPENRAWMQAEGRRQESDKLIYHLHEERFESSGDTVTGSLVQNKK